MPEATRDTVYFFKFNNYYNRVIKRHDTVADYGEPLGVQQDCNFVHGDGVNSSFTFNRSLSITETPDYVVVSDYLGNLSRWFVTNSFKSRDRQDRLELRRDVIADYYSDIVKYSPCLIRKGFVKNNNPLIFNDEGVRYNKIKQEERLIKDNSNCSYIVGFIANNAEAKATINGTIKTDEYDYYYATIDDFPLKHYTDGGGNTHDQVCKWYNTAENLALYYSITFSSATTNASSSQYANAEMTFRPSGFAHPSWYTNKYNIVDFDHHKINDNVYCEYPDTRESGLAIIFNKLANGESNTTANVDVLTRYANLFATKFSLFNNEVLKEHARTDLGLTQTVRQNFDKFIGKKIKIGNVIYNVSESTPVSTNKKIQADSAIPYIVNNNILPTNDEVINMAPPARGAHYSINNYQLTESDIYLLAKVNETYLQLSEASVDIKTSVDSPSNRTHLAEQPYDMFMLINESNIPYKVGVTDYVSNHEVNINMAQAIIQAYSGSSYDVQIVPFNPMQGTILADGTLNFYNYDVHAITDSNNAVVGHYVMCNSADIKLVLNKDELKINPADYKADYNLKEYRLCSPNQETIFEFSPAMNEGVDTWEITANYRPYASYIKVQPTWKGLYGSDRYNNLTDFRGLVYNSSLCVTQLNDAWASYVANNKNFQQLFDNQINTLTKQNEIQMNALEETLGWRSYTGMPFGSIARVVGGSRDIDMQRELNNVAIRKLETDFKYQLDNIKSMPHTIKKLTNINGDTRVFPYIEISSCSSIEEESFDLKMRYTGYTIMTTGYIENYLKDEEETFIQADLIRLILERGEETADNHIAVEIASELEKGVYITKESE